MIYNLIECNECDAQLKATNKPNVVRMARSMGWGLIREGEHAICPDCMLKIDAEAKTITQLNIARRNERETTNSALAQAAADWDSYSPDLGDHPC